MQEFPLIDALWASLDKERPSGDDPARVVSALHRFYTDLHRAYLQGRRNRWKTPLFQSVDGPLRVGLEKVLELTVALDKLGAEIEGSHHLEDLRQTDLKLRQAIHKLGEEEKTFGLEARESPKLQQLDYLYEGWSRSLLDSESVETFLRQFLQATHSTRTDIAKAEREATKKSSEEELEAIEEATSRVDQLEAIIGGLLESLPSGPSVCRPLRDALFENAEGLGLAFHRLEQCSPIQEPCPFCGGSLSLSGRCRSCGRRLPHLEEVEAGEQTGPTSDFLSNNLRAVDFALQAWESDPDSEELWRQFQDSVRTFGKQVDAGRQQLQMLEASPDRPIDPASRERLDEAELNDISKVFVEAQRVLSAFAFQPFPPYDDLPSDWTDPVRAMEPRLQALEERWKIEEAEMVDEEATSVDP